MDYLCFINSELLFTIKNQNQKKYIIELNVAPRFQQAELIKVGQVEGATSKKEALEAFRFYLKSSLSPIGKTVQVFGQITYTWNAPLSAYKA